MEEDILKYSPTVMFRGTTCIFKVYNIQVVFAISFNMSNPVYK